MATTDAPAGLSDGVDAIKLGAIVGNGDVKEDKRNSDESDNEEDQDVVNGDGPASGNASKKKKKKKPKKKVSSRYDHPCML